MEPARAFWQSKLVAVTGGTGFLGYHLVRQLTALGAAVRVLALPPDADHPVRELAGVACYFGDLLDPLLAQQALRGCAAVFHLAGPVAVWGAALARMHRIHLEGIRTVLAATPATTRIIHTSSIVAVGANRDRQALSEDSPFELGRLRVDYVHAKRAAEEVALAAAGRGRDVVVVNPGYLVGPEDREGSVMGRMCERFWKGRVLVAPPGGFNVVDVRDVAHGHLLAAEHGQSGRRYILGGVNVSVRRLLRHLAVAGGLRPRRLPRLSRLSLRLLAGLAEGRGWLWGKEAYPSLQHARIHDYYWYADSGRAQRELGYRARPLGESLDDAYRWFADTGRLGLRGLNRWWMRPALAA